MYSIAVEAISGKSLFGAIRCSVTCMVVRARSGDSATWSQYHTWPANRTAGAAHNREGSIAEQAGAHEDADEAGDLRHCEDKHLPLATKVITTISVVELSVEAGECGPARFRRVALGRTPACLNIPR